MPVFRRNDGGGPYGDGVLDGAPAGSAGARGEALRQKSCIRPHRALKCAGGLVPFTPFR